MTKKKPNKDWCSTENQSPLFLQQQQQQQKQQQQQQQQQ